MYFVLEQQSELFGSRKANPTEERGSTINGTLRCDLYRVTEWGKT